MPRLEKRDIDPNFDVTKTEIALVKSQGKKFLLEF